jgi:hypothetical protein
VVGHNILWKKHRNMYARLLLGMVLSRNLTEPFDVNPTDGPLPPFPSHLRTKLKNISGPHESNFWRYIYHRIPSSYEEDRVIDRDRAQTSPAEQEWRFDMGMNEIESLRQLIQEQSRRIEILEEQITFERMNHESEIIRFMEHHRGEISALRRRSNEPISVDHQHRVTLNSNIRPSWSEMSEQYSKSFSSVQSPSRDRSFHTERLPDHTSLNGTPLPVHSANGDNFLPKDSFTSRRYYSPEVVDEQKEDPDSSQRLDLPPEISHALRNGSSGGSGMKFLEKSIPEEDSDFLKYLENFQSELRTFH